MAASTSARRIEELVGLLRQASHAYYNTATPTMTDENFDALVEQLRELDPSNPFLEEVGAPVPTGSAVVTLPHAMPSLDKIKPGQDQLRRFLANPGGFVLSEKLDGLSALWIPSSGRLFLRGDGIEGQDVSHLVGLGLQGLRAGAATAGQAIRGELILPRADRETLARSWVNGVLHRKEPDRADVSKIHFVAYEVIAPRLPRRDQFSWLTFKGYETAWSAVVEAGALTEDMLAATLKERRATSPYDTDGIVVALAGLPVAPKERGKNPKDSVAFKMPLEEQSAETTVREVIWGASAQGYLIPKLQFDPVLIGSASIQFCTAHNAKTVAEKGLGAGARIVIRRSGDVIPKLDAVITAAPGGGSFPGAGTYEWDATQTHIRLKNAEGKDVLAAKLGHFLKSLELPGVGPATAGALVEAGITGPKALGAATAERLAEILGPKTGASLWKNYRDALEKVTEKGLMLASSQMPRGVGESKLAALFAVEADPRRWKGVSVPAGWTAASLEAFWPALETYETWRRSELAEVPYPLGGAVTAVPREAAPTAGLICMTGFRDKDVETYAKARGFAVAPTFTGKVTHLLVPDGTPLKESEKTKAARAKGIPILTRSAFLSGNW
jgi:hypothetical protein